jgi:hypothetical protein
MKNGAENNKTFGQTCIMFIRYEVMLEVEMMGNQIQPMMYFQLNNITNGAWSIYDY